MAETFIEEIKRMSNLTDEERHLLAEMKPLLEKYADSLVSAFYDNLDKFERTREILQAKPGRVDALKGHLRKWLIGLADGEYGEDYHKERYRIGHRHVEVGLEPRYVIAAMSFCRMMVAPMLEAEYADDLKKEVRFLALDKVMDIDLNIMLQSYDDKRIQQFLEVTGFSKELFENMIAGAAGD